MTERELLEQLLKKVTNIETRVTDIETKVANIETEQQRQGDHIHQLIQIVGATNTKLEDLRNEVQTGSMK